MAKILRVLRHNGEMIISESVERYDNVKNEIHKYGCHIKKE